VTGTTVLDASAVLAFMLEEPAAPLVEDMLREPTALSAVNCAEVAQRLIRLRGKIPDDVEADLTLLATAGMEIATVDAALALSAGRLRARHYHRDRAVSLADCVAAALALQRNLPLATTDIALTELVRAEGGTVVELPSAAQ
jgi:ribonuclease VapC